MQLRYKKRCSIAQLISYSYRKQDRPSTKSKVVPFWTWEVSHTSERMEKDGIHFKLRLNGRHVCMYIMIAFIGVSSDLPYIMSQSFGNSNADQMSLS